MKTRKTTTRLESQMKWHNAIGAIKEKLSNGKEATLRDLQDICGQYEICRVLPNLMRINNYIYKSDVNMYRLNPDKFNDIGRVEQECRKLNREQHKEYNAQRKPKKTYSFTMSYKDAEYQKNRESFKEFIPNVDILNSILNVIPPIFYVRSLDTKHLITELKSRGYFIFKNEAL
jgi:hypothetical protein